MKKLLLLLLLIILCICLLYVPKTFYSNLNVEVKDILIVIFVPIFTGIVLSLILFTKKLYWERLLPSFIVSFLLMMSFEIFTISKMFYEDRKIANEIRQQAISDIKKGDIMLREPTGLVLPNGHFYSERMKTIDSLEQKVYGFRSIGGCVIMGDENVYNEVVEKYLEKRNGKNWRNEFRKKVDSVNKVFEEKEQEYKIATKSSN